jgi:hypothetical protein
VAAPEAEGQADRAVIRGFVPLDIAAGLTGAVSKFAGASGFLELQRATAWLAYPGRGSTVSWLLKSLTGLRADWNLSAVRRGSAGDMPCRRRLVSAVTVRDACRGMGGGWGPLCSGLQVGQR